MHRIPIISGLLCSAGDGHGFTVERLSVLSHFRDQLCIKWYRKCWIVRYHIYHWLMSICHDLYSEMHYNRPTILNYFPKYNRTLITSVLSPFSTFWINVKIT